MMDSPGYELTADRYELEVSGGCSRITVEAG